VCPVSNDYKNFSGAIEGCGFPKKGVNAYTCCKHVSYSSGNGEGKHDWGNIEGIGSVYLNK